MVDEIRAETESGQGKEPSVVEAASEGPVLSRRRLAFRPPQTGRPATAVGIRSAPTPLPTTIPDAPAVSTDATAVGSENYVAGTSSGQSTAADTDAEAGQPNSSRSLKKGTSWNHEHIMQYYEAVKQFGKDFDNISRYLAKKKVLKNKEQIKNFYFNSIKFVRGITGLDNNDPFVELCRDAKELFLVINSCEWRKKTGSGKYQPERLRELIIEGSTTFRSKKKPVAIKTPTCPALNKYFTKNRRLERDKFPTEITVTLKPMTYTDACFVVNREQNPLLRIVASTNDQLSRIFQLLQAKWSDSQPVRQEQRSSTIRLFPARDTEIGKVVVETAPVESTIISLNRLKAEVEEISEARSEQNRDCPTNSVTSYSAIVPNPFSIDETVVKQGLTVDNVNDGTVAELFCLCGMTNEITLVYSIEMERKRPAAWQILATLLSRDYGDAVGAGREEEARKRTAESGTDGDEAVAKAYSTRGSRGCGTPQPDSTSASRDGCSTPSIQVPQPLIESSVVVSENEAFEQQLKVLNSRKSGRRNVPFRALVTKAQSRITSFVTPVESTAGPSSSTQSTSQDDSTNTRSKRSKVVYTSEYVQRRALEDQQAAALREKQGPAATDFSHVSTVSPTCSFLSSLRTPVKSSTTPATGGNIVSPITDLSPDQSHRLMMQELFGGELSKSPSRGLSQSSMLLRKERTRQETMDHLFGDVSLTPTKGATQQSGLGTDSMQGMVNHTMNEMMTQNSMDFYKTFQPLVDTMETSPQKKRRRN